MDIFKTIREKMARDFSGEERKPESVADQSKEDQDLAGFVKNKVEEIRGQANRISSESIWMTNIAYILGFDSVWYNPALRQYQPANTANQYVSRNRLHANLLLPACQNRLARLLKSPPKYEVKPNSQEEEDKEAARLGKEVIDMIWEREEIDRKRIELGMWTFECGHSYLKVSWDDTKGEELPDMDAAISQDDPALESKEPREVHYEGDIRIDVVPALEVYPDPLAKTFDELTYLVQAKVRKLDYFKTHYPERGELVKEEGAWLLSSQYEMRINSLNTAGPSNSGTTQPMKNAAIELSYYEKKSKKYPRGRHVIVANGVLLKNDELPCGEIPFAKFDDVVIGGKYYSESLVTHARPLQDHYNSVLRRRKQWTDRLLAGKYIAAKGHGLAKEALNDQSGEVVEYDPVPGASEPHAISLPVMPSYAYTEGDDAKKQLYEIMGLSEVSRGQLPSASIPAQGMEILLEQDETRIGIETEQQEHAYARIGKLILKYAGKYYEYPRNLKGKGKGMDYKVVKFTGADLRKNYDVTVVKGSTVPRSKVMNRNDIMNLYNQGLLGNPQDPVVREKVLGQLEFGDVGEVWEPYRLDMSQIKKTIEMIEQEIVPEVEIWENHALHVREKTDYLKSDKADRLTPIAREIMEADMEKHVQMASMLANPGLMHPPDPGPPPMPIPEDEGAGVEPILEMPQNNLTGVN